MSIVPRASDFRVWILAAALAVAGTAGRCGFSDDDRRAVEAWLTCIDCIDNERQAVESIGSAAVPYLRQAALGPSPQRVANAEQLALRSYARIPSTTIPESTFVWRSTSGFVAMYQSRAAMSLGDVGTPAAIDGLRAAVALDSATADSSTTGARYFRSDVRRTIITALATARSVPFPSALTLGRASFHDTITVRSNMPGGLAGRTAQLVGAPFGNRITVERWGDDSLAIIAGAAAGTYALQLVSGFASDTPWVVPLWIHAYRYEVRNPASAPEMTGAGFPRIHFPVLGMPEGADSIDFFSFEPTYMLAIRVELDWEMPGELDLRWFECPPPGDPPALLPTPSSNARPEVSEVRIQAGRCVLLGVISRQRDHRTLGRLEITEITVDSVAARVPAL